MASQHARRLRERREGDRFQQRRRSWRRQMRRFWPPLDAGIPAVETFPTVLIDVGFGSNPGTPLANVGWTDITQYVHSFSIRRGRSSELDDFQAGTCTLELDNSDRRFDPTFTGTDSYLNLDGTSGCNASCPDAAGLDITGDISIRALVQPEPDWLPAALGYIVSKAGTGALGGYALRLSTAGRPTLAWSDGVAGDTDFPGSNPPGVDGQPLWLWETLDVDDGAGNHVITHYWSTDGVNWTVYDTNTIAGTITGPSANTESLFLGSHASGGSRWIGRIFAVEVAANLAHTDVRASPDFRLLPQGTTSFADAQGNQWTLNGSATLVYNQSPYEPYVLPMRPMRVRARINSVTYPLFTGFVTGWPQDYTPPNYASCTVQCVDAFEVLRQTDLPSSLYAYEVDKDNPIAWWRFGETSGLTMVDQIGGQDGTYTADAATLTTGSILPYESTDRDVAFDGVNHHAFAPGTAAVPGAGPFTVEALFSTESTAAQWLYAAGSLAGERRLLIENDDMRAFAATDTGLWQWSASNVGCSDGDPHLIILAVSETSGTPTGDIWFDGVDSSGVAALAGAAVSFSGTYVGHAPISPTFNPNIPRFDGTVGEVVIYATALSQARAVAHYNAFFAPWDGDSTGARIGHLLDVIGWPAADRDIDAGASELGPARLGTDALSAAKAVERTEAGRFYISPDGKVVFRSRHWPLTNDAVQAVWGEAADELPYFYDGFQFRYDRDQVRNSISGTRSGGATLTAENATSIASFLKRSHDIGQTLATADNELRARLEWTLDHYKDPLLRVEEIIMKPQTKPGSGDTWTTEQLWSKTLGLDVGQRHRVKRHPQSVGAAISTDVLIEGVTHDCDMRRGGEWVATAHLSPADVRTYFRLNFSQLDGADALAY